MMNRSRSGERAEGLTVDDVGAAEEHVERVR